MLKQIKLKTMESAFSVLPITAIVFFLSLTPLFSITMKEKVVFLLSSVVLIFSIAIFNIGAEMAMTPMGEYTGIGLIKTGKASILLLISLFLGLIITLAEPDLIVLGEQVKAVINPKIFVYCVGIGVGIFLVFAVLKIVTHKSLSMILLLFYMLAFALVAIMYENEKNIFLPLSFDSGGVTTGPITVPFIMAFGMGIAGSVGGKDVNANSFGLVSLCSIGPIIIVLILTTLSKGNMVYNLPEYSIESILNVGIWNEIVYEGFEVGKALCILICFFLAINFFVLKLPINKLKQIFIGIIITFFGLVVFLTTINVGFLPIGYQIGLQLAKSSKYVIIIFAFIIGMIVVLAEPAVQVLNKQVEDITSGSVTKKSMMIALSVGVGVSISLSVIRQIYGFSLLYYLIPGYFISFALSLFVPSIYTSIAFDSGGVASGPMTSTFIVPMMIGICVSLNGKNEVMNLAFGVVSLVAMTPLITIQVLGFKAIMLRYIKNRIIMKKILEADDDKIIYFEV